MTKIVKQKIAELCPASRTRPVGRAFASPTRPLETFVNNLLMEVIGDGEREKNKDGQERIILEDSRELETGIYRKEEAANMYIQANSAHPWALKMGVVKGELIRYLTRYSTEERFEKAWARSRTALLERDYTGGRLQKARGGVGWSDRRERIDKMDERARERAEGGGGRGYDKSTLSIYIPFRPGAEEWWEGGAKLSLREGLECLEHEEKEYMAQTIHVTDIKTPTLGGLIKKRNGDKEEQKAGEKSKKSKQKT